VRIPPGFRALTVMPRPAQVAVLGAGVAGLAAALLLARAGHEVTLVERDPLVSGSPEDAFDWPRRGIPHFLQPHAFIPRGRAELRTRLPDVYADLLAAGAWDVDLRPKLPGGSVVPEDEVLQYLGVRRPVLEWALRRAVSRQDGIAVRAGERVRGLVVEDARETGEGLDGGQLPAGLVVDALGRAHPAPRLAGRRRYPHRDGEQRLRSRVLQPLLPLPARLHAARRPVAAQSPG